METPVSDEPALHASRNADPVISIARVSTVTAITLAALAPNLAEEDTRDARRAFWTIKHGIKMSAMPAWGKTLDDVTIWNLVAFLRQCLP
jgi:hypothetical protein